MGRTSSMKPGERAFAALKATETEIWLFGYGVYEGEFEPPTMHGWPIEKLYHGWKEAGIPLNDKTRIKNPRIRLDNGLVVYGKVCWWGRESEAKAFIQGRKVTIVEPPVIDQEAKALKRLYRKRITCLTHSRLLKECEPNDPSCKVCYCGRQCTVKADCFELGDPFIKA